MSHDYAFGGLDVRCDIALPGLRHRDAPSAHGRRLTITARAGAPPVLDHGHFAWNGRYRLELGDSGDRWLIRSRFDGNFLIDRDGGAVRIVCATLPPAPEVIEVLLRRVLPRVPILWGATAIHASALAAAEGAVMLIGRSGAGKSTLCAALAHLAGWQVLGDDISVLWEAPAPLVGAGARGVCVWPASQAGLALPPERCAAMAGYDGKVRFEPDSAATPPLSRLRAFVFLDRAGEGATPRLDRMSVAQGVAAAVPQIIRFNPHGDGGRERIDTVLRITRAMRACPAWRLTYPASYAALPDVAALLAPLPMR